MFKNKLQEFCQKHSYPLPEYETTRDGPPHNPRFSTTVKFNSIPFTSSTPSRTVKLSQNDAAMLAFQHFTQQQLNPQPCFSSASSASEIVRGVMHLYKNQLQTFAQKRNLQLPVYASEWEGPPHAMRFRCKVTIEGKTFESPKFYSTLKDAEHAAAEVAFNSLQPTGVQEDDIMVYKNLLQEFVQKEGLRLPVYSTSISGEAHKPVFTSQVEIEGKVFTGQESKSKKQAEMSAAKVAYTTLKDRKVEKKPSSFGNKNGSSKVPSPSKSKASDSNNVDIETNNVSSTSVSEPPRRQKVVVYSRKSNVEIEAGGTLLPFSDDKWVAYSYYH